MKTKKSYQQISDGYVNYSTHNLSSLYNQKDTSLDANYC